MALMFSRFLKFFTNSLNGVDTKSEPKIDSNSELDVKPCAQRERAKRRSPHEMKELRESKKRILLKLSRESSKKNIEDLKNAGITDFIWRSVGDCRVCSECRKNNGKRFSLKTPPAIGYPGEHEYQGEGHCRCYAEPDWKGTPFDMN